MNKRMLALWLLPLMLILFLTGCSSPAQPADSGAAENYVPVTVETVALRDIASTVTLSGKLAADKDVLVYPKLPGKVAAVLVQVGDPVRKGTPLVTLDPKDVAKQVEQAEASLQLAEAGYNQTKERLAQAKVAVERLRALYAEGAIAQAELEQAELAASDSALAAVEAQLNQVRVGYRQAADMLADMTITSPIDGIVAAVYTEAGEMAAGAAPVAGVIDPSRLYTILDVTESTVIALREGQMAQVTVPVLDGAALSGTIDYIGPAADARTQLYPVKVRLDNPDGQLRAGIFVRVQIDTARREDIIAVPGEAVLLRDGASVVYVVREGLAAEQVVTLGLDTGDRIEITQGLTPGDQLIVQGQDYVHSGTAVKIIGGN